MVTPFALYFALFFTVCSGHENVPVLIWGHKLHSSGSSAKPGLATLHAMQFSQFLHKIIEPLPNILLFVDENLSVEDFSWKNLNDASPLSNLQKLSASHADFIYLPSVRQPLAAFSKLDKTYTIRHYSESFEKHVGPNLFEVHLREPTQKETRPMLLRSHVDDIARISEEFWKKYPEGLIAYTGRRPSYVLNDVVRHKRQAEKNSSDLILYDDVKTMIVLTAAPIRFYKGGSLTLINRAIGATKDVKGDDIIMDADFITENERLSFDFIFKAPEHQAWTLEAILVEGVNVRMTTNLEIGAPDGYSYYCAKDIVFNGESQDKTSYSVIFSGLQAQPRTKNNDFGPVSDCVPYFTVPIWSGLLVVFLMILVAFISIIFLLDIRTNDKFDDSKGRTIQTTVTD